MVKFMKKNSNTNLFQIKHDIQSELFCEETKSDSLTLWPILSDLYQPIIALSGQKTA